MLFMDVKDICSGLCCHEVHKDCVIAKKVYKSHHTKVRKTRVRVLETAEQRDLSSVTEVHTCTVLRWNEIHFAKCSCRDP